MGIQDDVEALKRIPLFAKVEPAKLKLLAFAAERATYMPGEALFHRTSLSPLDAAANENKTETILDAAPSWRHSGSHGA